MEYHSIKEINGEFSSGEKFVEYTRFTKEVNIKCTISEICTSKNSNMKWSLVIRAEADLDHHLVEDTLILMKKIAEVKCGDDHG